MMLIEVLEIKEGKGKQRKGQATTMNLRKDDERK